MKIVRSPLFNPAVLLALMAGMFTFDDHGVAWFWDGRPQVAVILLVTSAVMWVLLVRNVRRRGNAQ